MSVDGALSAEVQPGYIHATPGALRAISDSGQDLWHFLDRHTSGAWGAVNEEDRRANDEALLDGARLLSAYETPQGVKLWIITDADDEDGDRANTTVFLPEEFGTL